MADHHEVTPHVIGEMNTREQERTFNGFIRLAGWVAIVSIAVVIFLALANA